MGSFSVWHLLVILFIAGVTYGIYRFAKRAAPIRTNSSTGPVGVGGWLLLLVAGLIVLGPGQEAMRISNEITSVESQYPAIRTTSVWTTYKAVTWLNYLIFAGLSIYAGVSLVRGREISVVKRAKVLLWVTGPVAVVVTEILIPLTVLGTFDPSPQLFKSLIAVAIATLIWTTYLSKSRRVKATYAQTSPVENNTGLAS